MATSKKKPTTKKLETKKPSGSPKKFFSPTSPVFSATDYATMRGMTGGWLVSVAGRSARKTLAEWDDFVQTLANEPA